MEIKKVRERPGAKREERESQAGPPTDVTYRAISTTGGVAFLDEQGNYYARSEFKPGVIYLLRE